MKNRFSKWKPTRQEMSLRWSRLTERRQELERVKLEAARAKGKLLLKVNMVGNIDLQTKLIGGMERAWMRIPAACRVMMLNHWRGALQVEIAEAVPATVNGKLVNNAAASCDLCGRKLWFNARAVHVLDTDELACLVAHELAHSFRFATGQPVLDYVANERATDALATSWGFPPVHRETLIEAGWPYEWSGT